MFPSDVLFRTKREGVLDLYELLDVLISSTVLFVVSICFSLYVDEARHGLLASRSFH